ncbi:MAG: hypothetical protein L0271_05845 [Gemmatimonadetes bacterium]|nr:hypothetical protein [Gemmatimonadota bacterium]
MRNTTIATTLWRTPDRAALGYARRNGPIPVSDGRIASIDFRKRRRAP